MRGYTALRRPSFLTIVRYHARRAGPLPAPANQPRFVPSLRAGGSVAAAYPEHGTESRVMWLNKVSSWHLDVSFNAINAPKLMCPNR